MFNSNARDVDIMVGLKFYSFITAIVLGLFAFFYYVPGVRLAEHSGTLNPNAIALVSASVILSGMAYRNLIVKIVVVGLASIVLVLTGSRASAIAAIVGVGLIFYRKILKQSLGVRVVILVVAILSIVAVIAVSGTIVDSYLEDYFKVHDKYRGIGTGITGRLYAWSVTWNLFLEHPVLGVGFRAHELALNVASSAHNGYLAMLSEIGLFGAGAVFYIVFSGVRKLFFQRHDTALIQGVDILFGMAFGYLLLAIFERYLLNIGNPLSILFILAVMRGFLVRVEKIEKRIVERKILTKSEKKVSFRAGASR